MNCYKCTICQIRALQNQLNNIIQPFCVGQYYNTGDRVGSDNTLYICIKSHKSSPEIFVGNPEYWVADFN